MLGNSLLNTPLLVKSNCMAIVDHDRLSDKQLADIREGMSAMTAFWSAVEADPFWCIDEQSPVRRCILAALAVCDILHANGREDAVAVRNGLDVRSTSGFPQNALTIGLPGAPKLKGMVNAHLVVRLGDIILDPSHGQTQRQWNSSPLATAVLIDQGPSRTEEIDEGCVVKINAQSHYAVGHKAFRVTYFKLPRAVDITTRDWRASPDADEARRRPLVAAAGSIHREIMANS